MEQCEYFHSSGNIFLIRLAVSPENVHLLYYRKLGEYGMYSYSTSPSTLNECKRWEEAVLKSKLNKPLTAFVQHEIKCNTYNTLFHFCFLPWLLGGFFPLISLDNMHFSETEQSGAWRHVFGDVVRQSFGTVQQCCLKSVIFCHSIKT